MKTRRPWVAVSAAVTPDTLAARRDRFQDWPAWARAGLLDAVAPMAYAVEDARFRDQVAQGVGAAPGVEVWAGIGSYLTGLDGTLRKILIAREPGRRRDRALLLRLGGECGRGAGGTASWNAWGAASSLSSLLCAGGRTPSGLRRS